METYTVHRFLHAKRMSSLKCEQNESTGVLRKKTSVFGGLQSLGLQVFRCDSLQVEAPEAPEAPKAPEVPKVETVHEKAKKAWMIFTQLD